MVSFVNEVLEHVAGNDPLQPPANLSDVETALANPEAFLDALDFELRRLEADGATLLLVCEVELPDSCPDDVARDVHSTIARQLKRGVRPLDTVGRVGLSRYAVILPGARAEAAPAIAGRLLAPILQPRRKEDSFPDGTRVGIRACGATRPAVDARDLFDLCLRQSPQPLNLPDQSGALHATRTLPPPPRAAGLARHESPRVVFALGGGAARAAAHVGVLRAFEEHGVEPAGFAGTSAGALVSAMTCLGMTHAAILERFEAFTTASIYREMRRRYVAYRRASKVPRSAAVYFRDTGVAFLSHEAIAAYDDDLLESFVAFFAGPERDIHSLPMPFAVAATDLVTGRAIHVVHGSLHAALRATCALPGLFPPQRDGDRLLIDGSMVAEVPVRAAVGLGTRNPVVAVHLARPEKTFTTFETSSEVVLRSSAIVHQELVREQLRHADGLITAHVEIIGWLEFRHAREASNIGERAASKYLQRLMGSSAARKRE